MRIGTASEVRTPHTLSTVAAASGSVAAGPVMATSRGHQPPVARSTWRRQRSDSSASEHQRQAVPAAASSAE